MFKLVITMFELVITIIPVSYSCNLFLVFLPSGGSYVKCIEICRSDIENLG